MSDLTLRIPLYVEITANAINSAGEVHGRIDIEGIKLWSDTYPPATTRQQVLADMLNTLAKTLKAAR